MKNTPLKNANPKANDVAGEENSTPVNKAPREIGRAHV